MVKKFENELKQALRVFVQIEHELSGAHFLYRHLHELPNKFKLLDVNTENNAEIFFTTSKEICVDYFLMVVNKLYEFHDAYMKYLPENSKMIWKKLRKHLPNKKIVSEYRNRYIGHIHNKVTNQPLTMNDLNFYMKELFPKEISNYMLSLYNFDGTESVLLLVSEMETSILKQL